MKIPQSVELFRLEDEDEFFDKLNELTPQELLELQGFADEITQSVLTIYLAREQYGLQQGVVNDGTTAEV